MKSDPVHQSSAASQSAYYREVTPKPQPSLNALAVAKWGFIELLVIVMVVSLFRLSNRSRSSSKILIKGRN
ncbi:hypothetical protein ACFPMF_08610 [Larkinella bovis]|uniref:Uncharacterized protein n=1 Tax=Larkinella bovis TaxID=683041 RepID=A0ABW0I7J1_9BACT